MLLTQGFSKLVPYKNNWIIFYSLAHVRNEYEYIDDINILVLIYGSSTTTEDFHF